MANNKVGDFFIELALLPDMPSFDVGNKLVDGLIGKYNNLIGVMRNVAVVGMQAASQEDKTARQMKISAEALNYWNAAAKIAGVNANGLISSLGKLATVMNHINIDGRGLSQYSEQLGKLGLGFSDFEINKMQEMTPDEAFKKIFETAQTKEAEYRQKAAAAKTEEEARDFIKKAENISTIIGDITGAEGQAFYNELQRQGIGIGAFLNAAMATQYETNESIEKGKNAQVELNKLEETTKSIAKLFGEEVSGAFTDTMKDINDWFKNNKGEIQQAIKNIADLTANVLLITNKLTGNYISGAADLLLGITNKDADKALEGVKKIIKGFGDNAEGINKFFDSPLGQAAKILFPQIRALATGYELVEKAADKTPEFVDGIKSKLPGKKNNKVDDGIMRPDGTITQVAPDDWVFAARNVGDLARAFIPQNYSTAGNGPSEYIINQTFNVTGAKDIPQVIRQQAYKGTQDGLIQLMSQSSQRIQMMSGTR